MIKVSHLTKIYDSGEIQVKALDDVSFEIGEGEFVSVMGPSGSGKSTLMHILGALDVPTEGECWLGGEAIAKMDEDELAEIRNKKIGFVFQSYNLLPRTTALKNVVIPMVYGGVSKEEREKRARNFLKVVGLGDRLKHTPAQLSGGQKQRVAIARALVMDPNIILADEPTGNIAEKQAIEIMEVLENLNDRGHTIIVITHEDHIAEYAKRTIKLVDGKVVDDYVNKNRRRINGI